MAMRKILQLYGRLAIVSESLYEAFRITVGATRVRPDIRWQSLNAFERRKLGGGAVVRCCPRLRRTLRAQAGTADDSAKPGRRGERCWASRPVRQRCEASCVPLLEPIFDGDFLSAQRNGYLARARQAPDQAMQQKRNCSIYRRYRASLGVEI